MVGKCTVDVNTYLKTRHCRKYLLNSLDKINTKKKKSQFVIMENFREKKTKNKLSIVETKERMRKGQTVSFACIFLQDSLIQLWVFYNDYHLFLTLFTTTFLS